jgi:hypothetical protein
VHRDCHRHEPDADHPVKTWPKRCQHWFKGKRDQKAGKRSPAESPTQDFSYPDQRADANQRGEEVIETDAPFSRQRIDQVDGRKDKSVQAELTGIGPPFQMKAVD